MPAFQTIVDIGNRACQHVGARRITALTDDSVQASAINFCYDKLREAELRRNVWVFAVRKVALRPIDLTFKQLSAAAWATGTTYAQGAVATYGGQTWESTAAGNIGQTPGQDTSEWELYSGPVSIRPFLIQGADAAWVSTIQYKVGDTVSYLGHNFTALLAGSNQAPVVGGTTYWSDGGALTATIADVSYYSGELVLGNGTNDTTTVYRSLVTGNTDIPPTANWLSLGTVSSELDVLYPIGAGPASDMDTRNVYVKPAAFLREAPTDPKAGNISYLGSPHGLAIDDWTFENNFIVSATSSIIVMRFVASVTKVVDFDPMFAEGLACRIGVEICEPVTQSAEKLQGIEAKYKLFMSEARTVNGIESGPVESPEDDYITCRI